MAYSGSVSEDFEYFVRSKIEELMKISGGLGKRKDEASVEAGIQKMLRLGAEVRQKGETWTGKQLPGVARSMFESNGGTGAMPNEPADKLRANREKTKASVDKITKSMDDFARKSDVARQARTALVKLQNDDRELTKVLATVKGRTLDAPQQKIVDTLTQRQALTQGKIIQLRRLGDVIEPTVPYLSQKPTHFLEDGTEIAKGAILRSVPTAAYSEMVARTAQKAHENYGTLAGLSQSSNGWVVVLDGSGCGWTEHDDPQKANGMVVSVDEAFGHPYAHPNCQRQFAATKSIRDRAHRSTLKRAQNTIKKLEEKAAAIEALLQNFNNNSAIMKYAGIVGSVSAVAGTVYHSPAIRRVAQDIAHNNKLPLPKIADYFLQMFNSFLKKEISVLATAGEKLGYRSLTEMREKVKAEIDDIFTKTVDQAWDTAVEVPAHIRKILSIEGQPTKNKLYASYRNYADHVEYETAKARDVIQNLQGAVDNAVGRSIDEAAALDLSMVPARAYSLPVKLRNLQNAVREAAERNQDFLQRESMRTIAELVKIPFLKAKVGKVLKVSVGFSQKGRGELAAKIYDQVSKSARWNPDDMEWARRIGINLPTVQPVTIDDVTKALLPRITWTPGKVFGATVSMDENNLIPMIRIFPPGAWRKWLSFDSRLRSDTITNLIRDAEEAKRVGDFNALWWKEHLFGSASKKIPSLIDDVITNINVHRGGDFVANLRFIGTNVDSYGVAIKPDSEVLRLRLRHFTRNALFHQSRVQSTNLEAYNLAEAVVFPTRQGGLKITRADGEFNLRLMRFNLFKGNLMDMHKTLKFDYEQLVSWQIEMKKRYPEFAQYFKDGRLTRIRSLEDANQLLRDIAVGKNSIIEDARVGIKTVNSVEGDFETLQTVMRERFPSLGEFDLRIIPNEAANFDLEWIPEDRVVAVRQSVADNWTEHGKLRGRGVRVGWFPRGTFDTAGSLAHEAGHAAMDDLSLQEYKNLWRDVNKAGAFPRTSGIWRYINDVGQEVTGTLTKDMYNTFRKEGRLVEHLPGPVDFPTQDIANAMTKEGVDKAIGNWMGLWSDYSARTGRLSHAHSRVNTAIYKQVSGQATRNPRELIAEAFSEYLTSKEPRGISAAVGDFFANRARLRVVK